MFLFVSKRFVSKPFLFSKKYNQSNLLPLYMLLIFILFYRSIFNLLFYKDDYKLNLYELLSKKDIPPLIKNNYNYNYNNKSNYMNNENIFESNWSFIVISLFSILIVAGIITKYIFLILSLKNTCLYI